MVEPELFDQVDAHTSLLQVLPDFGLRAASEAQKTECPLIGIFCGLGLAKSIRIGGGQVLSDLQTCGHVSPQRERTARTQSNYYPVRILAATFDAGDRAH